ncbi:hypothetical protein KC640_02300 [Candidatus Dojkabacteria bacterium]|uniref:LiaI-LiaF-like transmembrane region domain-containing protein n=1 Tax=Candidatus Dojkabacteria bacterium TaxID=2099670 RepID=A0A955I7N3_9BACT|nr:hypothetical protein [Candidatus Dojkabacteria bacterium]
MKDNIGRIVWGIVLILVGIVWLVSNFVPDFEINWNYIWPLFLLVPGLIMWAGFLLTRKKKEDVGMLIPANILTFLALTFYVNIIGNDVFHIDGIWAFTGFMYPLSIALAFFITWIFAREFGFLIPAFILGVISLLIFCATSSVALIGGEATGQISALAWPTIIICLGTFILLSPIWATAMRKRTRWMGKSEDEWEKWGDNLGKQIENSVEGLFGEKKQEEKKEQKPGDIQEAELIDEVSE